VSKTIVVVFAWITKACGLVLLMVLWESWERRFANPGVGLAFVFRRTRQCLGFYNGVVIE
jgi:hypothetical protein